MAIFKQMIQSLCSFLLKIKFLFFLSLNIYVLLGDEGLPAVPGGWYSPHHGYYHHDHLAGLRSVL